MAFETSQSGTDSEQALLQLWQFLGTLTLSAIPFFLPSTTETGTSLPPGPLRLSSPLPVILFHLPPASPRLPAAPFCLACL